MKINMLILLVFVSLANVASDLSAYLYLAQFKSPADGPYVECYLNVLANSVAYKKQDNGGFQSKLNVLYLFKQNGEIKAFQKYTLESPLLKDSASAVPNFTDVQRISLDNGIYNLEVLIQDAYDSTNVYQYTNIFTVDMSSQFQFSDIELIESYKPTERANALSKNNFDIVPYVSSFYPSGRDTITFYAELYNSEKDGDYLFQYYIEDAQDNKLLNQYSRFKKLPAQIVTPFLTAFDISDLPTGNYNLVLNLKNRENQLLSEKKFFFQRYNSSIIAKNDTVRIHTYGLAELIELKDINLMKDYIKSTFPILNQRELFKANNILETNDLEMLKAFFGNFWKSYSSQPDKDWSIYKQNVELVNRSYSSQIKRGYETDRGYVYLKYGPPSDMNRSNHEPSTYPYEIWHYFELNGETDIKFVFYNREIVGDDYTLLHSNLIGELSNQYWQKELTKRNSTTPNNFDDMNGESQYGNRSRDVFER